MEGKRKISIINSVLLIMLVLCVAMGMVIILLSNTKREVVERSGSKNYATTEATTTNTWDVSKNGDGCVIATLSEDGTLTISGTGAVKPWVVKYMNRKRK